MIIVFGIFGLFFDGLGFYKFMDEARKIKNSSKAVIAKIEELASENEYASIQKYNISLEIESKNGPIWKDVETSHYYPVDSECEVYYTPDSEYIEFIDEVRKEKTNGILAGVGVGVTFSMLTAGIIINDHFPEYMNSFAFASSYMIAIGFILAGILGIAKGIIRYFNEEKNCKKVPGKIIDMARYGKARQPVYEFYDNCVRRTIVSTMSDRNRYSLLRREIGDKGTIVIDKKTGRAYCKEDYRREMLAYITCVVVGMIVFLAVLAIGM